MTRNDTIAFLTCVLPGEGHYCAVVFNTSATGTLVPRQHFFATIELLADFILFQDQLGRMVYHACASYQKPGRRTQANVLCARSLWTDVDTREGKPDAPYADRQEAAEHVLAFCHTHGLPRPLFVDSGYGIHCYWPFQQYLDPVTWRSYASALKSRAAAFGLKIDPARATDIASILRTPGTYNRKQEEARLVQSDGSSDQHSLERFGTLLGGSEGTVRTTDIAWAAHAPGKSSSRSERPHSIVGRIEAGTSYGAVYADDVADRCAQIAAFRASGNHPEPLWYAYIGVLARCEDGDVKAHEWSKNDYPAYSADAVDARLQRSRLLSGATTCARLHDLEPGTCERCPFWGKINSPISVPTAAPAAVPATGTDLIVASTAMPKLPQGFKWSDTCQLMFATEGNSGEPVRMVVCEHPVYLVGVQTGELDGTAFSYRFSKFLPQEGWSDVIIEARALHGAAGISEMFGRGAVIHEPKLFLDYVRHAVDDYHREKETALRYDQFGWKNENTSFFFGKMLYTPAGPVEVAGAKEVAIRQQWVGPTPKGSLHAWTEAADSLFAADLEAFSAVVLAGFAAPLMRFQSQNEGGCIIHLFTPDSGKGKTTALTGAWSVWGQRDGLSLTNEDTRVSKPIAMGALGNLPVIYDELRDKDPEYIRRMVVMFTEGRDRMRGTIDGTIRHTKAGWNTLLLSASNKSLLDQLIGEGTDAPAFRALELTSELPPSIDTKKGDKLKRVLEENAGHAGDAYLRYLVQPDVMAWTRAALEKWTQEIYDVASVGSAHRFRVRAIGATAVAARLVNELEILHFQSDRIVTWLIQQLSSQHHAGTVSSTTAAERAVGTFGEFINDHLGEILVVADRWRPRAPKVPPILRPYNRLTIRHEVATQRVYIAETNFRDWVIKRGVSPRMLLAELEKQNVVFPQKRALTLSAGTDIPGAQVMCIEANAAHPAMSSLLVAVTELQHQGQAVSASPFPRPV